MTTGSAYPLASAVAARLDALDAVGSTNTELVRLAAEREHGAVVVTLDQTAGRGRLGRSWVAPAGRCLAASVLLRPDLPIERFGWFPLLGGLCLAESIAALLGTTAGAQERVAVKWPNDVHVGGRKISGVLAELVPGGVVLGTGVNLTLDAETLPTPTSTSLRLEGADGEAQQLADAVLADSLRRLLAATAALVEAGGDPERSGLLGRVRAVSSTPGRRVRIVRAGRADAEALAVDLDADGRLVVRHDDGSLESLAAADVTHLRPA